MTEQGIQQSGNSGGGDTSAGDSKREKVVRIISKVISKVEETEAHTRESIVEGLIDLKNIIDESRREISMARPGDIRSKDIPIATDELDAVVQATAEATGSIMDACDEIQNATAEIDEKHANAINDAVMKIYEACSFQDITGQRITKVVSTLQSIEQRVGHLISVLGDKISESGEHVDEREGDEALLNGPQLPDQAISQEEIDKLMAELDGQ